jgi:hypothetical protein
LTRFPCFREVNFFYSDMKCCKFWRKANSFYIS